MENQALIEQALLAREKSISPYSHFSVGAALLCKNGSVYLGANIENSAYPVCICAERVAFFRALMDGQRDFVSLAVAGAPHQSVQPAEYCTPCGSCRQVMAEFCAPDFVVLCAKTPQDFRRYTLEELLPHAFSGKQL